MRRRLFMETKLCHFFRCGWALHEPSRLLLGIPFSATLLLILLAHEMGHYLYCRYYGVYATLPFFIPAPTLIGTLGAVIRIRSPIRSRCALFDIGIAGPIAGFVAALIVLVIAMHHSRVVPGVMANSDVEMGYPLIFHILWTVLPLADVHGGSSLLQDIYFHPTAIAAWVGMFATALNLLPGGQLDGGHIVFALNPRAHRIVSTADDCGADSDGVLFLGGLAAVGNSAAHQRHAASHGRRMAGSDSGAALAGGVRIADDDCDADARAVRAQFAAAGRARDPRTIGIS